jgi:hypothetical protein
MRILEACKAIEAARDGAVLVTTMGSMYVFDAMGQGLRPGRASGFLHRLLPVATGLPGQSPYRQCGSARGTTHRSRVLLGGKRQGGDARGNPPGPAREIPVAALNSIVRTAPCERRSVRVWWRVGWKFLGVPLLANHRDSRPDGHSRWPSKRPQESLISTVKQGVWNEQHRTGLHRCPRTTLVLTWT